MNEYLATLDRLDEIEDQLNRRFNKLHRKLDKILTMLEDWDAPIIEASEEIKWAVDDGITDATSHVQNLMNGWISSDERLPDKKSREIFEIKDLGPRRITHEGDKWMSTYEHDPKWIIGSASTKGTYWREIQ